MSIDLTKDIEVLQGMYGTGSLPYGKVVGEMFVSSMQPCDTGLLPSHLLTHWNTRCLLGADDLLGLYAELEAYRRLFENAPRMLALLKFLDDGRMGLPGEPKSDREFMRRVLDVIHSIENGIYEEGTAP